MSQKTTASEKNHCAGPIELGMKIAIWAGDETPHPDLIRRAFPMCRATSYRYHDLLRSAKGLPPLCAVSKHPNWAGSNVRE